MAEYTTIEMLEAIELNNPMKKFFSKTFFPKSNTHIAEKIEVDVKKGKRKMAPFVAPRMGGKIMKRDGFRTNSFSTPKIAPQRIMTIDDINKRGLGENVYSKKTPEERADELLAKDLAELEEAISDRKEWMAREIILNGKINVVDEENGIDVQVDFNLTNKTVLEDGLKWNKSGSDPIADLKEWRRTVINKIGKAPNICIMASDTADAFIKNEKVLNAMDVANMRNIVIQPKVSDSALTFMGHIAELDVDIYSYDEWFINDDGEEEATIPSGYLILANSEGVGSFEHGAVTQMENGEFITYEAEIVPKQWANDENDIKMLRLTSRPLPFPYDVDSWYVAVVL